MKEISILAMLLTSVVDPLPAQPSATTVGVQGSGLVLDHAWDSPLQGSAGTMKELASLLSPYFNPSPAIEAGFPLEIFDGVMYLMPLELAKTKLGITQRIIPKVKIVCGGFPKDSFNMYVVSGTFDGDYDQMDIITDLADQVCAIQLVAGNPKTRLTARYKDEGWHTFDFVGNRTRAMTSVWIFHDVQVLTGTTQKFWQSSRSSRETVKGSSNLIRISTEALSMKPGSHSTDDAKILQTSCWYIPKPLAELILYCSRKNR